MTHILIGLVLISVTVLSGCGTKKQALARYNSDNRHKAWAESSISWGYSHNFTTVEEAIQHALDECKKRGQNIKYYLYQGTECRVTNIDGIDSSAHRFLEALSEAYKQTPAFARKQAYADYSSSGIHKAWAESTEEYGYAVKQSTVQEAVSLALEFCELNGGRFCKITNIDGLPKNK